MHTYAYASYFSSVFLFHIYTPRVGWLYRSAPQATMARRRHLGADTPAPTINHSAWHPCKASTSRTVAHTMLVMIMVPIFSLLIGNIHPTNHDSASGQLLKASRRGNLVDVRRCFLKFSVHDMDVDGALDAAAAHSHMHVVEFLVNMGATDMESALLSAVARDDAIIVAYLISCDRICPAKNIENAQVLASNFGSVNAEFVLTRIRF